MNPALEPLSDATCIFRHEARVIRIQIRTLDPWRQSVMNEVDNGGYPKLEKFLERTVSVFPVPDTWLRIDSMPRDSVAGTRYFQFGHQIEITAPLVVVVG